MWGGGGGVKWLFEKGLTYYSYTYLDRSVQWLTGTHITLRLHITVKRL